MYVVQVYMYRFKVALISGLLLTEGEVAEGVKPLVTGSWTILCVQNKRSSRQCCRLLGLTASASCEQRECRVYQQRWGRWWMYTSSIVSCKCQCTCTLHCVLSWEVGVTNSAQQVNIYMYIVLYQYHYVKLHTWKYKYIAHYIARVVAEEERKEGNLDQRTILVK